MALTATEKNLQSFCASTHILPRGPSMQTLLRRAWKPGGWSKNTHLRRYERRRHQKKSDISGRLNIASRKRNIKTFYILQKFAATNCNRHTGLKASKYFPAKSNSVWVRQYYMYTFIWFGLGFFSETKVGLKCFVWLQYTWKLIKRS